VKVMVGAPLSCWIEFAGVGVTNPVCAVPVIVFQAAAEFKEVMKEATVALKIAAAVPVPVATASEAQL